MIHTPIYLRGAMLAGAFLALGVTTGCSDSESQTLPDLRVGAVFAMSNARAGNTVVAYIRNADGTLDEQQRIATGGNGSGSFEDSANALILTTLVGEISPNNIVEPSAADQFLLATNAGSDTITVFRVDAAGLVVTDLQASIGAKPVSVTVSNGVVYVLNSGEVTDDLLDAAGDFIPNCTTGASPTITGFTLSAAGVLTPMANSTRNLSGEAVSGCTQVSFSPDGNNVVVTERFAKPASLAQQVNDNERIDDEGVLVIYSVNGDGTLSLPSVVDATGQGPFAFAYALNGTVLVSEQNDGLGGPARGGASSYVFGSDNVGNGPLLASSPSISNGGTDTCWIVVADNQTVAYTTSFFADGRITSYEVDDIGLVRVIDPFVTGPNAVDDDVPVGASDLSLSRNSNYLYQLNSLDGTVSAFRVNSDGSLSLIDREMPFPQPPFGNGADQGQAAPLGLASS